VRRYRSDPRLDPFRSVPPWIVPQWQAEEAERIRLRRQAKALLTPERLRHMRGNGETLGIREGGLAIISEIDRALEDLPPRERETAEAFQRRCYAGGLGHAVLGRWAEGCRWQNVLLPKVLGQLEYNREIVRRIGPRGLSLLREVLYGGLSLEATGYRLGGRNPEEARSAALRHLSRLLNAVAKKAG
jgi:hypothetical protein